MKRSRKAFGVQFTFKAFKAFMLTMNAELNLEFSSKAHPNLDLNLAFSSHQQKRKYYLGTILNNGLNGQILFTL